MKKCTGALDKLRHLILSHSYEEAQALVNELVAKKTRDPRLFTYQGYVQLYFEKEVEAVDSFLKGEPDPLRDQLGVILYEHFYARLEWARKTSQEDLIAEHCLALLKEVGVTVERPAGIKLSACLIVRDEAESLARCLTSLEGFVDEIVVVDTGSTDNTVEIAEKFGAKIGHFEWCDDFSAARNVSIEMATGDWILQIDADEELLGDWHRKLAKALTRPHFSGYHVEILNNLFEGSKGDLFVHTATRLFRNVPQARFTGKIHEQIAPSLLNSGLPLATLENAHILHSGYLPSVMKQKNKLERDIVLLKREVEQNSDDAFQWFNLANAYLISEKFEDSEKAAKRCTLLLSEDCMFASPAYMLLSEALQSQSRYAESLEACSEADERFYGGILIEYCRAKTLMMMGELEEALVAIDRCCNCAWPLGMPGDHGILTHKRKILRGKILTLLGRFDDAVPMLAYTQHHDFDSHSHLYTKAVALERVGRLEEAQALYEQGEFLPEIAAICLKGLARIAALRNENRKAMALYEKLWRSSKEDRWAWVGWAQACEAEGDADAMIAAYEALSEIEQPNEDVLINWGRALAQVGQDQLALQKFKQAQQHAPENANAFFNCGDLYYQMDRYFDAGQMYEEGLRYAPEYAQGWFALGNCLARVGAKDAACELYERTLTLCPDHYQARHNLELLLIEDEEEVA